MAAQRTVDPLLRAKHAAVDRQHRSQHRMGVADMPDAVEIAPKVRRAERTRQTWRRSWKRERTCTLFAATTALPVALDGILEYPSVCRYDSSTSFGPRPAWASLTGICDR